MTDLPDECAQMVCTSPPYWGLRKYSGLPDLIWGGDDKCEHQWISTPKQEAYSGRKRFIHSHDGDNAQRINRQDNPENWEQLKQGDFCSLCGAWKGQYGLEPTPEMYIEHTLIFLREIRRVLRKDGVVFWNIGDSYAGSWGNSGSRAGGQRPQNVDRFDRPAYDNNTERPASSYPQGVIKPKDLCLIPFRVAIAAQEDGWWVRSVIIWSKPNPMPESVTDRPTESHEYILMLTKSKKYYWDAEAVREPQLLQSIERLQRSHFTNFDPGYPYQKAQTMRQGVKMSKEEAEQATMSGRNIRSVWEFPTQPYPEAHFAVFPEKLPEICIKAATPEVGCCSKCGAPYERVFEKTPQNIRSHKLTKGKVKDAVDGNNPNMAVGGGFSRTGIQFEWQVKTLGWKPTCNCNADKAPSLVLDPFAGSGTTLWVAKKLGRRAVGYELSEEYCKLALERNRQAAMELDL
jgi:DNA modification methylase